MAQEAAGSRQRKRAARGIVGQNAPAIKGGGDLPGQAAIWGDEGGGSAVFCRLAQNQGDCKRLCPGGCGLDQGHVGGGPGKVGQVWPICQPLVCDRGGPHGKTDQSVARGVRGGDAAPRCDSAMR